MINLEDLWQEARPQNVPGTTGEQPNWSRKCARSLEQFTASPEVNSRLEEIDRLRTGKV
jgi:4-alpha-glucanotransferase